VEPAIRKSVSTTEGYDTTGNKEARIMFPTVVEMQIHPFARHSEEYAMVQNQSSGRKRHE
jgi:hypothetical protein